MSIDELSDVQHYLASIGWVKVPQIIADYKNIPLTLPVSDVRMRRLSQVLTNNGYITYDTCEGHGKRFPRVFFYCQNTDHVKHLAHLLAQRQSPEKHFGWHLIFSAANPDLNPRQPHTYLLTVDPQNKHIDISQNYHLLMQDVDIVGVRVMTYFEKHPYARARNIPGTKSQ